MEEFATVGERELVFERRLKAPLERVWRALVDSGELAVWLAARAQLDARVGGDVLFQWDEGTMEGQIRELREPELLEYTWGGENEPPSVVRFELTPDGTGTHLTLTHTFEEPRDLTGFGGGWHYHLELLATQIAGGKPDWDWNRFNELKAEYERRAQHEREAELANER
jgi:uncharacterized protein YndB with AHSA1/START domain